MAKINLEMGFLFLYEWLPLFDTLTDAEVGRLMLALIRRQKDGEPFPSFENPLLGAYAKVMEATIVRRLAGREVNAEPQKPEPHRAAPPSDDIGSHRADPLSSDIGSHRAPPPSEAKRSGAESSEDKRNNNLSSSSDEGVGDRGDTVSEEKSKRADSTDGYFDEFWSIYPRKVGKGAAKKAFQRLKPDRELTDAMISAIDHQKRTEQWTRDGGRFIPHPATWLSREQWNDEQIPSDYGIYYPPSEDDLADLFEGLTIK